MPKSVAFNKLRARPGKREALAKVLDVFVNQSHGFAGCEAWAYFLSPEDPDLILLLECYVDEEARVALREGEIHMDAMDKIAGLVTGPPEPSIGWLGQGWGIGH